MHVWLLPLCFPASAQQQQPYHASFEFSEFRVGQNATAKSSKTEAARNRSGVLWIRSESLESISYPPEKTVCSIAPAKPFKSSHSARSIPRRTRT